MLRHANVARPIGLGLFTLAIWVVAPMTPTGSQTAVASSFAGSGGHSAAVGVPLVGRSAPHVAPGELLDSAGNAATAAVAPTETEAAIPLLTRSDHTGRRSFAFTDASGAPVAPPTAEDSANARS